MNSVRWLAQAGLVLGLVACVVFEAEETTYLRSARDRATQDQVRQALGTSVVTKSGLDGEVIWVYQVYAEQPGNYLTSPETWCDEYVLTFDEQAVLRHWTHRQNFHGGELEPTYCVPGGADGRP